MIYVGQKFDDFKIIYVDNKRTDHKELKQTLIRNKIKSKTKRKFYHNILIKCQNGTVTEDELREGNKLLKFGFNFHDYIPLQYRRSWIEQPD